MIDPKNDQGHELAGKVDALLGKHSVDPDLRNIPLLTDLVEAPEWLPGRADIAPAADFLQQLTEAEIDQLSHDIFARVSQRIDAELASSLEARLSEQFQTQLNATVTGVLADMKQSIANEIGDAVNAALADRLRKK